MWRKLIVLVFVASLAGSAWAAPYVGEVADSWATNSAVTVTAGFSDIGGGVGGLTNGGLFATDSIGKGGTDGDHHSYDQSEMWMSYGGYGESYTSPAGVTCKNWVQFAFDKSYDITNFWVWNGGEAYYCVRAVKDLQIHYSNDGANWTKLGDYTFSDAYHGNTWLTHNEDITMNASAKYVVFSLLSNQGSWSQNQYTMSEVRFFTPEPATIAMLGLGGFALLRRKFGR